MSVVLIHKFGPCAAGDGCEPHDSFYQPPVYGPFSDVDTAWEYVATVGLLTTDFQCVELKERIPLTKGMQHRIACKAVAKHVKLSFVRVMREENTTPKYEVTFTNQVHAVKEVRDAIPGASLSDAVKLVREVLNRPQEISGSVDFYDTEEWESDLANHRRIWLGHITRTYATILTSDERDSFDS